MQRFVNNLHLYYETITKNHLEFVLLKYFLYIYSREDEELLLGFPPTG